MNIINVSLDIYFSFLLITNITQSVTYSLSIELSNNRCRLSPVYPIVNLRDGCLYRHLGSTAGLTVFSKGVTYH